MFHLMERLRLLNSYIESQVRLNALSEHRFILAYFPLHNSWQLKGKNNQHNLKTSTEDVLLNNILIGFKSGSVNKDTSLVQSWTTSLFNQKIPLNKIKNYFGEKIAFYFEFLRYFQTSLLLPCILGSILFIVQKTVDPYSDSAMVLNIIYSVFMSIWAIVFLEVWTRKETAMALIWGQSEFEKIEIPRPQFRGKKRRSPITDEMDELHFEWTKRMKFTFLAGIVTLTIISMVLAIVAGLLIFKKMYSNRYIVHGTDMTVVICSTLNAIQIQFFNFVYSKLVVLLTNLENHKTQVQYEDSLILKTFIFQFVNSFNSLYYIAFLKTNVEGCVDKDHKTPTNGVSCLDELNTQLIAIYIVSYLKNAIEIGVPYFKYHFRKYRKAKNKLTLVDEEQDIRHKIETQFFLENYLTLEYDGTIDDYLELAVQFGYLTLFAMAFPLSTPLAFVGFWLEMFTDKLKIIRLVRRPIPLAIKDIGNWWYIFSAISVLAIFTNTAIFCFTSQSFKGWLLRSDYVYLIYAVIVIILLVFRSQLQSLIPKVAEKYQIVMSRQEYILERILRGGSNTYIEEKTEAYDGTLYFSKLSEKPDLFDVN